MPTNAGERAFAIPVLLFGMLMFSLMTAAVTSSIMRLQSSSSEQSRQFWLLRRYLTQNNVPGNITVKVLRYLEFKGRHSRERIEEANVPIILGLSANLLGEVRCAVNFGPLLTGHPLFAHINAFFHPIANDMTNEALVVKTCEEDEVLFHAAEPATEMLWVVLGRVIYFKESAQGGRQEEERRVTTGDWMCEMCLWVTWVTRGEAVVDSAECSLICVEGYEFEEVISKHMPLAVIVLEYAECCREWLNSLRAENLTDVVYLGKGHSKFSLFMDKALKTVEVRSKDRKERQALIKKGKLGKKVGMATLDHADVDADADAETDEVDTDAELH